MSQVVVDCNKCLTNVYVGMPWTFNDSHIFKTSNHYWKNIIIVNLMYIGVHKKVFVLTFLATHAYIGSWHHIKKESIFLDWSYCTIVNTRGGGLWLIMFSISWKKIQKNVVKTKASRCDCSTCFHMLLHLTQFN